MPATAYKTATAAAGNDHKGERRPFEDFQIPARSAWAVLAAVYARRGERQKIYQIKEYLYLKRLRDQAAPYDEARFFWLKKNVIKPILGETDTGERVAVSRNDAATPAERDFLARYEGLIGYLEDLVADRDDVIGAAMDRATAANRRKIVAASALKADIDHGKTFWDTDDPRFKGAEHLVANFPDFVRSSLTNFIGRLKQAEGLARKIKTDSKNREEFKAGHGKVQKFLEEFNGREDITLVDLMYYLVNHRGATTFRDSTSFFYAMAETLFSGMTVELPSEEQTREGVDIAHNCVDPEYQDRVYALKLADLNLKYAFGLTPEEIDLFGTIVGTVSTIMRGYGIDQMDDRIKQHMHNSADHSLRVCITVAGIKRTLKSQLEYRYKNREISPEDYARETEYIDAYTKYLVKKACIHDASEFLGELLGNNLVGRTEKEQRFLRRLRNQIEDHVFDAYTLKEAEFRLKNGPHRDRWAAHGDIPEALENSLKNGGKYNFDTPFVDAAFDVIERLQTNHEIVTLRQVGRINAEGKHENSETMTAQDNLYTFMYALSKVIGNKAETTDAADLAEHERKLYYQRLALDEYMQANRTAVETGAPLPHKPKVTQIFGLPNTDLSLDRFLKQINLYNYDDSLFKKFVRQTIADRKNPDISEWEAAVRQRCAEESLGELCQEVLHSAKKHAGIVGMDQETVEIAIRKLFGEGITMAQAELRECGLQYLHLPEMLLAEQRYRVLSTDASGTVWGNPEKPAQLFEPFQGFARGVAKTFGFTRNGASELLKIIKTPAQALQLVHLKYYTEKDFRRPFETAATQETGGDASLTLIGMLENGLRAGLDSKTFASLNPLVTFSLAGPHRAAEAIEKCYGHVLSRYSEDIGKKYGLENAVAIIKKEKNLKQGFFEKNENDTTKSGELAEDMYARFVRNYEGAEENHLDEKTEQKLWKISERAERYILREMVLNEIAKIESRRAQTFEPIRKRVFEDKLATLREAEKTLRGDRLFRARAKYYNEIRFGIVSALGLGFAVSGTGLGLLTIPFTGLTVSTSAIFGLNLALAGGSAALAAVKGHLRQLPATHALRRGLSHLPRFEWRHAPPSVKDVQGLAHGEKIFKDKSGLYIAAGRTIRVPEGGYKSLEEAKRHLDRTSQKAAPGFLTQVFHMAVAAGVTPVLALADRSLSQTAFANQSTAQGIDAGGIVADSGKTLLTSLFNQASGGLAALAQGALAVTATLCFNGLTITNNIELKRQELLKAGETPILSAIKTDLREEILVGGNESLLNALRNTGARFKGTRIGRAGSATEKLLFTRHLSGMTYRILERLHRRRTEANKLEAA